MKKAAITIGLVLAGSSAAQSSQEQLQAECLSVNPYHGRYVQVATEDGEPRAYRMWVRGIIGHRVANSFFEENQEQEAIWHEHCMAGEYERGVIDEYLTPSTAEPSDAIEEAPVPAVSPDVVEEVPVTAVPSDVVEEEAVEDAPLTDSDLRDVMTTRGRFGFPIITDPSECQFEHYKNSGKYVHTGEYEPPEDC